MYSLYFLQNLVPYHFKKAYAKKNISSGHVPWSSVQTKKGSKYQELYYVGSKIVKRI